MKNTLLLFCLFVPVAVFCLFVQNGFLVAKQSPKNIILLIGDGMGLSQVTAGKIAKGSLAMERCPVSGLVTTWSANKLVTDSAAGATAMATGFKTRNGMISVDTNGVPLKTVVEFAEEDGKSTGLVSTSAITHATPAGFAAHVPSRNQYEAIAHWLAVSGVDVLFGGGLDHFCASNGLAMAALMERMPVAITADKFRTLGRTDKAAALLCRVHPPSAAERNVSLAEMTHKAIEILARDEDGFFLMVEGSQIDWAGHRNDAANVVEETVDFDDAVGAALNFASVDGNTLVIITSDHETGGYAVLNGSLENKTVDKTGFVHKGHTATMVPLFAFGPGSEEFAGVLDNTDIGKTMIRYIAETK